jgi:tRNA (guanine-N7-)-methyltransferase
MRQKLIRFNENASKDIILEEGKGLFGTTKNRWNEVFGNKNDIILEFGCGRGEYTVGLAEQFPEKNFLGMDLKGERIWYGANYATEHDLQNVRFLRMRGERMEDHIGVGEIAEIWLPFPGPRPKKSEANRRLTHPNFLERYQKLLKPGGFVHLKTDSEFGYSYTLAILGERKDIEVVIDMNDLYNSPYLDDHYGVQTHFEKKFLKEGKKIHYLKWRFI